MRFLYSFGIFIYSQIIRFISPFNTKAKLWYTGRKNLDLSSLKPYKGALLIQCSSLGEFEQAKPLIDALKVKYPSKKIVLSFFSPSGFESKKNLKEVDEVIYLPIDTPKKCKAFVAALEPEMAFFIKYDFWPNLFGALKNKGCKIFLISTIFRPDQLFFKPLGSWYRKTLNLVDFFFVQNQESKSLLSSIGLNNSLIAGDTRFDQVLAIKNQSFTNSSVSAFCNNSEQIAIAGSTWLPDELIISDLIQKNPDWKWIIAPHEVHKEHIEKLENVLSHVKCSKYSDSPSEEELKRSKVLIIDTIGLLKNLYRFGNLAFIGGGFGKGIHNTLEPAVYGIPVLFGPKNQKFQEAQDLRLNEIGFEVNPENVFEIFSKVTNPDFKKKITSTTEIYIQSQKGAIDKIMNALQ